MGSGRLLVVQHEDDCPPDWFGQWWEQAGLELDVLRAHEGRAVPAMLADHDALVVLGGEMGASDDADYHWLVATRALIATVVAGGGTYLGICLGHQLAAVALGGEVRPNPRGHATGVTPVALNDAGRADPLLGRLDGDAVAVQWNNDVVTRLPGRARLLATAPDGSVQAARFGSRAWGVQFHPEASPATFRRWTLDKASAAVPRADGIDVVAAARAVAGHEEVLRRTWQPVARAFAGIVTG